MFCSEKNAKIRVTNQKDLNKTWIQMMIHKIQIM